MSQMVVNGKLHHIKLCEGDDEMVFEHAEDVQTLKKIGINVAVLLGVMFALIAASVIIG